MDARKNVSANVIVDVQTVHVIKMDVMVNASAVVINVAAQRKTNKNDCLFSFII